MLSRDFAGAHRGLARGRSRPIVGFDPPMGRRRPRLLVAEELERAELEPGRDALEGAEGEVAFAAFEAAHVGAVDAELLGERFLREATLFAAVAEVAADCLLQVALHAARPCLAAT